VAGGAIRIARKDQLMHDLRPVRNDQLPAESFRHTDLAAFDAVIDVRSPAEYAEDHIPGAVNHPVLDDAERAQVGTLHRQATAFEARKLGAALVARNIAFHLDAHFHAQPRTWKPLIYCWRGGARSGAMTHVLRAIGWHALQLDGGYKGFRSAVRRDLDQLPLQFEFRVLCGRTGSGKSRLLVALQQAGAQVLDLEAIARHRGSLLGDLPGDPQPSQKRFETEIWDAMHRMDPLLPVWVEAESKRVGLLRVPDMLMERMHDGQCIRVEATQMTRIALLQEDYRHLIENPSFLLQKLERLKEMHSSARIEAWKSLAIKGDWTALVEGLLTHHYDPAYSKSMYRNYRNIARATEVHVSDASAPGMCRVAGDLAIT
jgi:tRNA 2-selenouridine synthase